MHERRFRGFGNVLSHGEGEMGVGLGVGLGVIRVSWWFEVRTGTRECLDEM